MNRWSRHLSRLNSADLLRFGSFKSQIQYSSPRFSIIRSFETNSVRRRKKKLAAKVAARKELPEELSRGVLVLTCESTAKVGSCRVYLVGTRHGSQESVTKVQAVIRTLKPQVVFLELCSHRKHMLTSPKCKGSEFQAAFVEARVYGAKVILGDRPIQITRKRTLAKTTLLHKIKWLIKWSFLPLQTKRKIWLGDMKDVDLFAHATRQMSRLKIIRMKKEFPNVVETFMHERDKYMSTKLLEVASEHSSVVAVVGSAHLPGIKKHWKQPVELRELLEIPAQKAGVSAVEVITSLGVVAAIISGIYFTCKK